MIMLQKNDHFCERSTLNLQQQQKRAKINKNKAAGKVGTPNHSR